MKHSLSFKTVLSVFLLVLLPGFFANAQDGSQAHPYPVGDIGALASLARCVNTGQSFTFENGLFVVDVDGVIPAGGAGTYFEQTADIDMNSAHWNISIGSPSKGFEGTYLGGGHKIMNLTLSAANPALFRYSKGHISDLTIENPVFNGTFNCGGALATYVMGGTIDNCHVTGNDLVFSGKDCGALIGWVGLVSPFPGNPPDNFKADSIRISNCSNRCHITSTYQQSNANDQNSVAGVVAVINARHYVVTRCFNTGDITSTYRPKFQNDELCFAGVVGRGLLPNYPSEITYCYNRGDITAHCGYIGGVAGFFNDEAGISNSTRCAIDYCFNTGNITGECVLYSDDPSEHVYADSSLNVFSLGGVVAPCKALTRYCFNTGNITLTKHPHPKFNIWGDQGVAGVGSNAEHCFNVGEINNYEERNGRAAGVARDTARFCLNAACVYDRNPKYTFSPHNIARIPSEDCFSDAQMSVDGQDGNLYPTSKIIGEFSFAKGQLGEDWIYEDGRYPRLKWTDTCDWARDIAKVACTPIILADTVTDIHHVKNGIRLTGCDSGVVWKAPEGNCLFDDPTLANTACSNNAIQPALQPLCGDFVTVAATLNGDTIKTVTLLRSVAMPHDTLTVDNLDDLKELRDGVNTGEAFFYKSYKLPRYADGVTFKLTTDLDMQSESPWVPIGSVFSGSRFAGLFLGDGHTIDNLSLDDATPYFYKNANVGGLFGMLSGEVRDLTFTNLHADSTTIVAGAVCALMNGATIENCIVKGHIETSRSSNNYAISGTAGLAGASLTARDQDFNFICRDTIRNCVNYADIITHVGRGANIASHSVGGIIGHGGVVIDCANAGDISGGSECGYIGGIGGDMTSALRCFNTGRVTIAEAPQAIDYFVGGVVGKNDYDSTIMYCYNAGTVDGSDRSPVGGIVGYGAPRYCYMTNTVTGRGKYLGSIAGTVNPNTLHCYYDKQMSPLGGENGQDAPGRSLGLETTGMLGSALQSSLGNPANWIFTPGLYPQLAISADVETQHAASLRAQLSRVSVMPVVLGPGQNWMSAHDSIPLRGCDEHHFWTKLQGCVTVDSCHVTATDRDMGVIELAATIDSVPYRFVTLKYNMDETHALVIKNAAQFDTMRMVINKGGFYNYSDSTFHTTIPASADTNNFVAIDDGGNERFFKLITDIDINDIKEEGHVRGWIPVGGFADDCCALYEGTPFKGTFDGGGHTIRHLTFQQNDIFHPTDYCYHHQGLFGTVDGGTVKNLRIAQSDTTLGNSSAFLCSVNKGGTLYHCEIDSCTLTISYGASNDERHDHALLCAKNKGGTIDSCQVKNSVIAPDSSSEAFFFNIGGVCALNDRGVVSRCIAEHLTINDPRQEQGALQSVGGICGKNFHGQLQFDAIRNSQITLKMNLPHKFIGGICGLSGYDPGEDTDEQIYAHIPSVISDCNSDSTIINAYTHGDNDSTKNIMNIGGIVGSCQGRIVQLERCSTMENSRILAVADTVGGICGRFCGEGGESYCNTCGNNASVTGNDYVGGIVGLMSGAQLHEGNNQGEVRSLIDFEYNSGYYAGGIAGAVVGESSLFSCYNSGTVAADSSYVGGIAGALMGESNLFLCINHGDVSGFNQVGGLAGLILKDAWFEESSNSGLVRGIAQVGGLVGYLKSSTGNRCSNSHNYADTIHFSAMGGGVCGYAEDTTMLEGCSSVMILPYDTIIRIQNVDDLRLIRDNVNNGSNSYEGIVIVLDWDLNLGNGWDPIGTPEYPFRGIFDGQDHTINFGIYNESNDYQGFFGYMQGTVKNVNFTQCSVIGRNYVGVIAGYCHGTISNCYSYREKVEGEKYVGGLVGMASYSEIQDCFNGNNIVGEQYVGGIVGDFASCKNDNCYDTMKYDLYGGNVSRCYNYGMVRATGDTSHVGGIAGFTSAEVKHCYNSGIVDGKDFVGGLCGLLDGDNLHHCYNAGHVSATGNNKGAVCGSLNLQNTLYNCFYDRQMCTVQDDNASGYNTLKMTGTALQNVFGTDYWSYNDNEYPTLKTTKRDSTYFHVSVKPLLLPGNMPVDKVVQPFCGVTGNAPGSHVEWSRYGTATETVGTIHLADKDSITLLGCGVDTLKVSHPGYGFERLVPIVVAAKEATVETVHTCGSIYKWNKNNQYYNETGFYTYGDNCDNKQALDLTITPVTITSTPINSTCETIPDGAVLVSVTGGPGNGFRYLWTNSYTGDTISNTPALTNITAGYYSVTVTDSLFPTCEQTSPLQLSSSNTVELTIKSCDTSKTYDGTALTGNRYVVTEQGFEPDTLSADSFAILANGDTLRVTFGNGTLINVDTLENGAKFTYSISNGIDHSCHYDVDTIFGTLSITPRPVVITVNDASKEFGDEDPTFTGSVADLVNEGDLGTITYSRENSSVEAIGNYPDVLTASYTENPNYTVSINKGDFLIDCRHFTTRISNWPAMEITGLDECFYPATVLPSTNTDTLPTADQIQTWIVESNNLSSVDFEIAIKDTALKSSACDWQWARIYTISTTNSGYCDVESRVLYVSGGDQSDPVRSNAWPWTDGILDQDACLASFDMDMYLPTDQDLFDDCSELFITHSDVSWGNDRDGWTIQRSYVVSDSCGHTIYDTIRVSGRDQTPPVAANTTRDTLWAEYTQCLCDSIQVTGDIESLTTLLGLSDECTGDNISLVSKTKTLKTGNRCADTVVIAYIVADAYSNSATFYHAQFIQDTTRPTFDIVPKDIALCLIDTGRYEETVNSVIYDEYNQVINRVANIHDNCTKLQGSFVVHNSIDLDNYTVVNGIRQYEQYWTVTDSCGNVDTNKMIIKVNPLPTIRIDTLGTQTIFYGEQFQDITINNEYSVVSLTPSDRGLVYSEGKVTGWLDSVGTYSYTATATSNQTPSCGSVDTVITIDVPPRPITIAAGSATRKYDGTPLTSPYYECTVIPYPNMKQEASILIVDSIASVTIIGSQIDVGSSANVPSNAVITRRTDATVNMNSSYAVSYANGTLTVTTNDTLIKVIPADGTKVYDGTPLTKTAHEDFTVTGVPQGLTWTATADGTVTNVIPGEGEKAVNAVTEFHIFDANGHDVTAFFTNIQDSIGTLTITPKPLTITAVSDTKEYDGTALTNSGYTHTDLVEGETIESVTMTGSQIIAGTSDNVPSAAVIKDTAGNTVTTNYDITYVNGTLEMTQKPLTITAGSDTKVYDGTNLTNNTYTHTDLAAGDSLWSVTVEGKALYLESSNVPSDAVIKNAAGDTVTNSYHITYVNGTLSIIPTKLYLTAGDSTKVYDGTDLTCHTYTCIGLLGSDSIAFKMESVLKYADTIPNEITEITIYNRTIHPGKDSLVTNGYDIERQNGTLVVTKKDLTITAASATKEYDGTALKMKSYTHSELVPGDSITSIFIIGSQTVAGSSDNVPEGAHLDNAGNDPVTESYNITYVNGTLTVTKKPLTITADGATKEYDGTALTKGTYSHTPLAAGDSIWSVTITGSQTLVGSIDNVPSAAVIKNDTLVDITDCYEITYTNGTLEVTPNTSEIVVTPAGGTKTYDGTPLTKMAHDDITVTGVPEGFTWTATADGTVTNVVPGIGEKTVNAITDFQILTLTGDTVTDQFANIDTSATDTLKVTAKAVTLASGSKSREYNGSALTNSDVEGINVNGLTTETGWVDGEGATYSFSASQLYSGSCSNAFDYTLNDNTTASNYAITKTEGLLEVTVSTTELKATSASGSWTYDGDAHTLHEYTVTYGEESYPVTITAPATRGTATLSTGDVVTITPFSVATVTHVSGTTVTNSFIYKVEHSDQYSSEKKMQGTLTVTPATLTITTGTASRDYDGTTLTATGSISGFITPTGGSEETATFTVTGSQTVVGSSENSYDLIWDGTAIESDYTLSEDLGTLTVNPAQILVKADAKSKLYATDDPTLTAMVTGGVENEDFVPTYTVSRIPGENVGQYVITPNGEDLQGNYAVTYDTALLTITPVSILVKADVKSKVYGTDEPTLTATVTGVVEGDNFTPIYTMERATGENIGEYVITPSGDVAQGNYTVSYDTALLTITPASLLVKADAQSKVYGDTDPTFTATLTGLANNDEESVVSYSLSRVTGEDIGEYVITPSGDVVQGNYTVTYDTALLTITPASLLVKADAQSKVYGDNDPTFTATVTGVISGESFLPDYNITRATGEIVGEYVITPSGDIAQGNYTVTYDTALLIVNPKPLTVTAASDMREYNGTALTASGYTYSTLAQGDTVESVTVTGSQTLVGTSDNVPSAAVIRNAADEDVTGSYDITYVNGTLEVTLNSTVITVTPGDGTKVYDGSPLTKTEHEDFSVTGVPEGFTWTASADGTVTNVVPGDGEKVVNAVTDFKIYNSDSEEVTNQFSNIDISATGTLEVTEKAVTITVTDTSKTYGLADPTFTGTVEGLIDAADLGVITYIRSNSNEDVGTYAGVLTAVYSANSNYSVTVIEGTFTINCRAITMMAGASWPENLTAQNNTFADADTTGLLDAHEIQTLFEHSDDITVEISDEATSTGDCQWTWTRTYTVTDLGGCQPLTGTMSVSGSDQTAPSLTITDTPAPTAAGSCQYEIPTVTYNVTDNSIATPVVTQTPAAGTIVNQTATDQTVTITLTATDACGNTTEQTTSVTVPALPSLTLQVADDTICIDGIADVTASVTGTSEIPVWTVSPATGAVVDGKFSATAANNYTLTATIVDNGCVSSGEATILVAPQPTIDATPSSQTITYGDAITPVEIGNTNSTISLSALPNGLLYNSSTQTLTGTPTAIGTHVVTATATSDILQSCGTAELEITIVVERRAASITVDNASKLYGENDPVFTGTVTGLAHEGDLGTVEYYRTNSDETVGSYAGVLTASYSDNPNYEVTVYPGDFLIQCASTFILPADGWHAIASILHDNGQTYWNLNDYYTTGAYDMFRYDEPSATWENQKPGNVATGFSQLERGRGYIYRCAADVDICLGGIPNSGTFGYALSCTPNAGGLQGFHLIGNPYGTSIYKGTNITYNAADVASGYYALRPDGTWIVRTDDIPIDAGQGILIQATAATELTFTDIVSDNGPVSTSVTLAFTVSNGEYEDVAYALLDDRSGLRKMPHLNEKAPTLCIPVEGHRYALANLGDNPQQFNLSFQPATSGEYTISFGALNAMGTIDYLHLIDLATDTDIDLLSTPTYTFHGSPTDNTNRFLVKLSALPMSHPTAQTHFADIEGDRVLISGNGQLQVYDALGRCVASVNVTDFTAFDRKALGMNHTGVYLLRLDNDSQKIVVK